MRRERYVNLTDLKTSNKVFLLCWLAYFSCYIGRLNFSVAMVDMISTDVLSKSQAGAVSTAFFICYGIGQFTNGFLADRLSPFKMIFSGLFVSSIVNLSMGLVDNYYVFIILWGLNGFSQSMIWTPILKIFVSVLSKEHIKKASVNISLTIPLGTLAAYLLSAFAISYYGWRGVFTAASIALAIVCTIWAIGSKSAIKKMQSQMAKEKFDENDKIVGTIKNKDSQPILKLFAISGVLILILPVAIHGMLKDGVTTWVPTFINENFAVTESASILLTMFLPIINVIGVYTGRYINTKYFNDEVKTTIFFFMVSLTAMGGVFVFKDINVVATVILLSLITASMMAINVMMITFVPMKFEKYNMTATVSGILNAVAYGGCSVSNYASGYLADNFGWMATLLMWTVSIVVAIATSFFAIFKWSNFKSMVKGKKLKTTTVA